LDVYGVARLARMARSATLSEPVFFSSCREAFCSDHIGETFKPCGSFRPSHAKRAGSAQRKTSVRRRFANGPERRRKAERRAAEPVPARSRKERLGETRQRP
jgi:hypothetical protein